MRAVPKKCYGKKSREPVSQKMVGKLEDNQIAELFIFVLNGICTIKTLSFISRARLI
jgi:hypothetical protein